MTLAIVCMASPAAAAGDFAWTRDFNSRAQADPLDFRARLKARFRVGDAQVEAVLDHAAGLAEGYILLRLGELARQPLERAIEAYEAEKGRGWGAVAKRLGIKPGSPEFHALKQGQDLYPESGAGMANGKDKPKGKKKKP
jgi:hypothetical protein